LLSDREVSEGCGGVEREEEKLSEAADGEGKPVEVKA